LLVLRKNHKEIVRLKVKMLSRPLMTVHDAANVLQVQEATVRSWIRERRIRAIKLGKEWRIAVKDLEDFLNDHTNLAD
jgi:excisionase family DNA binding protein